MYHAVPYARIVDFTTSPIPRVEGAGAEVPRLPKTPTNKCDRSSAHLFLGGQPPAAPFPECGPGSPTDEEIGCETPPTCEQDG